MRRTWRNRRGYTRASGVGKVITAPYDVLIRRLPKLQTRQPDVLLISWARLAQGGGVPKVGPLPVARELVVEILSDSETQSILGPSAWRSAGWRGRRADGGGAAIDAGREPDRRRV